MDCEHEWHFMVDYYNNIQLPSGKIEYVGDRRREYYLCSKCDIQVKEKPEGKINWGSHVT